MNLKMSQTMDKKQWRNFVDNYEKKEQQEDKICYFQIQIDRERVGQPTVMRYFDGGVVIGTKFGYLLVYDCDLEMLVYSEKGH